MDKETVKEAALNIAREALEIMRKDIANENDRIKMLRQSLFDAEERLRTHQVDETALTLTIELLNKN